MTSKASSSCIVLAIVSFLLSISCFSFVFAAGAPGTGESLDQLYEKAKKEGGKITLYAPLSSRAMEVIPQAFMKKFPGLTVNHIDATPDELLARASAEARDFQMLIGFAKRKYKSDEKAVELFKHIAANQVEFHKGHSQLIEFLVAGQRALCFTCYSHHFPPRVKKGAPIQAMLTEGVGEVGGTVSVLRGAPHPNAGLLWARWAISEEGQRVWAQGGETPAHPHVEPLDKVRPEAIYMLTSDDIKEFPKYEKIWKEIFQIR